VLPHERKIALNKADPDEPAAVVVEGVPRDLTRTTLTVLCMVGLIAASFWILRPFIPALIWATMIVVATWSSMLQTQQALWGRRWLAVIVMSTALLLAFVIPFSLAITTIVDNADDIASWVGSVSTARLPALPDWVQTLPLIGHKATSMWKELASTGPEELTARLQPYARNIAQWFVAEVGNLGMMALQFLLTLVISAILYARGESAALGVLRFFRRLGGPRGEEVVILAGQAIRGVALGVVLTALAQSVAGGIGLAIAGVPFAGLLTAFMFVLAVAQIGAGPILFCAVAWMYWQGDTGWATGLLVWSLIVSSMDNVLRPILIRRGADLPLLVIFAGVIGGLVAFGLVGIFVGPLVLAVCYRLANAWVTEAELGGSPTGGTTDEEPSPAEPVRHR
jgi:predicted PurR-regulated permease PerM